MFTLGSEERIECYADTDNICVAFSIPLIMEETPQKAEQCTALKPHKHVVSSLELCIHSGANCFYFIDQASDHTSTPRWFRAGLSYRSSQ